MFLWKETWTLFHCTGSWNKSLEISFGRKRSLNLEKKSYSFSTLEEKNFFLLVKIWVSFDTLSIQDCRERIVKGEQWQLLSEWEEADLSRSVTFLSYPLMSARQSGGKKMFVIGNLWFLWILYALNKEEISKHKVSVRIHSDASLRIRTLKPEPVTDSEPEPEPKPVPEIWF